MSSKLHKRLVLAAALLSAGASAQAADLPARYAKAQSAPLPYDWTGFYLGANLGGAFSDESAATPFGSFSPNPSGVLGGIQLGYNFLLAPNWLIGVEGEFDWTSSQANVIVPNPVAAATIASDHNWYDTLEGRLGFVQGPWLYYFKGGAAWINADYSVTGNFNGIATGYSVNNTRSGWTIGGGIEYMLAPGWSAKLEYDYLDFGNQALGVGALGSTIGINTTVQEVKIGVNYHWLPGALFGRF